MLPPLEEIDIRDAIDVRNRLKGVISLSDSFPDLLRLDEDRRSSVREVDGLGGRILDEDPSPKGDRRPGREH